MKKKMVTTVMILVLLLSACTPVKEEGTDKDSESIQSEYNVDNETREKNHNDGEKRGKEHVDGETHQKCDKEITE